MYITGEEGKYTTMSKEKMNKRIDTQKTIRVFLLGIYDALAVLLSAFLALYIRFDMHFSAIDANYLEAAFLVAPITILITWIIFKIEHLYDSLWEYASVRELFFTTISCVLVVAIQAVVMVFVDP